MNDYGLVIDNGSYSEVFNDIIRGEEVVGGKR